MARDLSLYDQTVDITEDYLGPAAQRFIDRQIANHIKKPADKINKKDLAELIAWISAVVSLLTDDEDIVHEYIEKLESLTGKTKKTR